MPKLAQILKRSSGSRQVCVSVFFFSDHCIKQIDSMLPWVCSVIDHRGRQNVVKTTVTHSPAARVPLLCFYDILTSSVIYYWTDARQHGIYLLNFFLIAAFTKRSRIIKPFNSHEWRRLNFSLQYQYNINQINDENREKYQFGDN